MSEIRGVTPPNSVEAERSVLGAMLQDSNAVLQAAEALTADDFYQPQHREIFDAMFQVYRERNAVDLVTVEAELSRRGISRELWDEAMAELPETEEPAPCICAGRNI